MNPTKPQYHHGDLRNALIAQAVKLVEEYGADGFSLREAARLVGVSANAAYRHFADKSDLLTAVAEVGFLRMDRRLQRALAAVPKQPRPADTALERLRTLGRAYVDFAVDHPELLRVMFGLRGFASLEQSEPPKPAAFQLLGTVLDELAAHGVLPPERRPGAELKSWTVVHGFASLVIQGVSALQKKSSRSEALEQVLDFAIIGLCGRRD